MAKVVRFHEVGQAPAGQELTVTLVVRIYSHDGTLLHEHLHGQVSQILWRTDPAVFEYGHRVAP